MMRVLVTGSRDLEDAKLVLDTLDSLLEQHGRPFEVIHGGCATGADDYASMWTALANMRRNAIEEMVRQEVYRADDFGPWPACGPKRNSYMVGLEPDICLGFFQKGAKNKGTTDCVMKALRAGIPIRTFWSE